MPAAASTAPASRRWSARALLAAILANVVLSLATDQVFHALDIYPPWGQPMWDNALNALALSYRLVYGVGSGYLAARLAPSAPMRHALAVGGIGLLLTIVGGIGAMVAKVGPLWYPLALVVTALPCAWLGGRLYGPAQPER